MTVINKKFTPPALPLAPIEYDQRQQDQFQYALRLYLNLLDKYLTDLTNLLNTGETFENITASTITTGTLTADTATIGDLTGTYVDAGTVDAYNVNTGGLTAGTAVVKNIMANNFYGGTFYGNGRYIYTPYNQFESRVDQSATSVGDANALKLEVTDFTDDISITGVNNTRITFAKSGIYSITYSLQFKNTDNDGHTIDIWIRYNGSDYAYSNTSFFVPARKSSGDPSYLVAVTTITGDAINDNDYVEIMWRPSNTAVTLEYLPAVTASAGVTPDIPATPSAIVQAYFISAQFPPAQRVAPAPVSGFGEIGSVTVVTL
jgi:hypothetical protein